MDYHKLNQVLIPITTTMPDVILLLEQMNTSPGTWYAAIDLAGAFFSVPVNNNPPKRFANTTPLLSYLRGISTPRCYVIISLAGIGITVSSRKHHTGL